MATGGIYLGGGIAPKILPKLKDGTFARAFGRKGRLSPILERIPVRVIVNSESAIFGAAQFAHANNGRAVSTV
jgi:glucokinase